MIFWLHCMRTRIVLFFHINLFYFFMILISCHPFFWCTRLRSSSINSINLGGIFRTCSTRRLNRMNKWKWFSFVSSLRSKHSSRILFEAYHWISLITRTCLQCLSWREIIKILKFQWRNYTIFLLLRLFKLWGFSIYCKSSRHHLTRYSS